MFAHFNELLFESVVCVTEVSELELARLCEESADLREAALNGIFWG